MAASHQPIRRQSSRSKISLRAQTGEARKWNRGEGQPMLEVIYPTYFKAETLVADLLSGALNLLSAGGRG